MCWWWTTAPLWKERQPRNLNEGLYLPHRRYTGCSKPKIYGHQKREREERMKFKKGRSWMPHTSMDPVVIGESVHVHQRTGGGNYKYICWSWHPRKNTKFYSDIKFRIKSIITTVTKRSWGKKKTVTEILLNYKNQTKTSITKSLYISFIL